MKTLSNLNLFRNTLLALMIAVASGCANDRSSDDYKRDKAERDFAAQKAAIGTYQGVLYSSDGHRPMGVLKAVLNVQGKVVPSTDGASMPTEQAGLIGELSLSGTRKMSIVIRESRFDPVTNRYRADIVITRQDGSTKQTLSIEGKIVDGKFDATIGAQGYSEYSGTFTLLRDSAVPAQSSAELTKLQSLGNSAEVLKAFTGQTTFGKKVVKPMNLTIISPQTTPDEDFLNVFVPERLVQVTLNYGESLQISYENALWDRKNKKLHGQTDLTFDGDTQKLTLDCDETDAGGAIGFSCAHIPNNGDGSAVAQSLVSAVNGAAPELPVNASENKALNESFLGEAHFPSDGQTRSAVLNILHPRATRENETKQLFFRYSKESVLVTLNFGDNSELTLKNAKYAPREGSLNGVFSLNRAGSAGGGSLPGSANSQGSPASSVANGPTAPGSSSDITVDCIAKSEENSSQLGAAAHGWDCTFFNSSQGQAAVSHFAPISKLPESLNGIATPRDPVLTVFKGTASRKGDSSFGVEMQALYPARSREEDLSDLFYPRAARTLVVTLTLHMSEDIPIVFQNSSWDQLGGSLNGSLSSVNNVFSYQASLQCSNFYFTKPNGDFNCLYIPGNALPLNLKFHAAERPKPATIPAAGAKPVESGKPAAPAARPKPRPKARARRR